MSWLPEPADWPRLKKDPSDADAHVRELLPVWVNGTLEPSEVARVVAHLERCAGCRAAHAAWTAVAAVVGAAAPAATGPNERPLRRVVTALDDRAGTAQVKSGVLELPTIEPALATAGGAPAHTGRRSATRRSAAPAAAERHPARRRTPLLTELSLAAVLILILAAILAGYRLSTIDDGDAAPTATVPATETPNPAGTVRSVDGSGS